MRFSKISISLISLFFSLNFLTTPIYATETTNSRMHSNQHDYLGKSKDREIIAYVMAIDEHEVDVANEAKKRPLDIAVVNYANMLHDDHIQNLRDIVNLSDSKNIPPKETKSVKQFENKGEQNLNALIKTNNDHFQNAFITAMIKGHEIALDKINLLNKDVKNHDLSQHLLTTRDMIQKHLDEAKEISKNLLAHT